MPLTDELEEFYSQKRSVIVADEFKFKEKLKIGEDAFTFLRASKNLSQVLDALG
ncbi:MAG: hypothetical protein V7739_08915 [Motiliproteus sp.]